MTRWFVPALLLIALVLPVATAQDPHAQPKPSVLVLPFVTGEGMGEPERFLGVAIQNLVEEALVEIPELEETWFIQHIRDGFRDENQLRAFLRGEIPAPEYNDFACVVTGKASRRRGGYFLTLTIRAKDGAKTEATLPVDFPKLVKLRRRVGRELRSAACSPVDAPPRALWPERLGPQAASALGRGLADYFSTAAFGSDSRKENFEEAARVAPGSYLAQNAVGWAHYVAGDIRMGDDFGRALALHRGIDALDGLGNWWGRQHQLEKQLALVRERADRRRESPKLATAKALVSDATSLFNANDFLAAIPYWEQALEIEGELKEREYQAATLNNLGKAYSNSNQYDKAIGYYQQAVETAHEVKNRGLEGTALNNLGEAYTNLSQYDKAIGYYQQAIEIAREVKNRASEGSALVNLGEVCARMGQYDKAIGNYEQALAIQREARDRTGEGTSLNHLGEAYGSLSQYEKGIGYLEQALAIEREVKNRRGEAAALSNLGSQYEDLGQYEKAIGYYEQALQIAREVKMRNGEAVILSNLATTSDGLGQYEKAIGYYEQALVILREAKDHAAEGNTLCLLGFTYRRLEQFQKAIGYLEQGLAISREVGNRVGEGWAFLGLGGVYEDLNQGERAIGYYRQALAMAREVKDRAGEVVALDDLGNVYLDLGQYENAIGYFEPALAIVHEVKRRVDEGTTLNNLGNAYNYLGQYRKAIGYFEQAIEIAREVKNPLGEAQTLHNLGSAYGHLGEYDKGTGYFERALAIERELKIRGAEAITLTNLMGFWRERQQPRLAVVFGKQAINILQDTRSGLRGMDQSAQRGFLQSKESTYRELADLLAGEGRLAEAQQVLDLLKEDEFSRFVQRDSTVAPGEGHVALTPQETEWEKRYAEVADRLTELGVKRGWLLAKPVRTPAEETELEGLEANLEAGNRAFQTFLDEMETAFRAAGRSNETTSLVREAEGLMETLRALGPGTVAVYTVVGEKGYRSILITPDVQKGYYTPVPAAELNKKILAFRELVRNPSSDPRPLARELYEILVKPMQKDLEGAQARTIMWSLDGPLRYMPVAALYDGERYLVESYRNVVFTPASQSRLKDGVSRDWRGLGLGVSQAHPGFQPLPNVPNELRAIIRDGSGQTQGILPGTVKLDGDFTDKEFRADLHNHYSVVHLASHFDFAPGADRNSFLLLGDGSKLTLEEFRGMPQVLQGVQLLTLSACDTAVGGEDADGKEVEGLAVLAQRQGAAAVIATLWAVADESTALLMKEFYRIRASDQAMTKAEALRQAQLELLTGKLRGGEPSDDRGVRPIHGIEAPRFAQDPQRPYAHPYFWAPFLLMGNWK
jgi:CHAT domain-containing protein/tetratricopeptide (TPR) repeat protein